MDGPSCDTCVYFGRGLEEPRPVCRRFPPTLVGVGGWLVSEFPRVPPAGWCGEWADSQPLPVPHPQRVRVRSSTRSTSPFVPNLHLPLSRRNQVIVRDGPYCRFCGVEVGPDGSGLPLLTIDHLVPISRGGARSLENMCVACGACNHGKGDRTLEEFGVALREPNPVRLVAS